ncbi:MAG: hypothetical protein ACP5NX_00720 [Candidatus Bilamarchaeaceae archaeon]
MATTRGQPPDSKHNAQNPAGRRMIAGVPIPDALSQKESSIADNLAGIAQVSKHIAKYNLDPAGHADYHDVEFSYSGMLRNYAMEHKGWVREASIAVMCLCLEYRLLFRIATGREKTYDAASREIRPDEELSRMAMGPMDVLLKMQEVDGIEKERKAGLTRMKALGLLIERSMHQSVKDTAIRLYREEYGEPEALKSRNNAPLMALALADDGIPHVVAKSIPAVNAMDEGDAGATYNAYLELWEKAKSPLLREYLMARMDLLTCGNRFEEHMKMDVQRALEQNAAPGRTALAVAIQAGEEPDMEIVVAAANNGIQAGVVINGPVKRIITGMAKLTYEDNLRIWKETPDALIRHFAFEMMDAKSDGKLVPKHRAMRALRENAEGKAPRDDDIKTIIYFKNQKGEETIRKILENGNSRPETLRLIRAELKGRQEWADILHMEYKKVFTSPGSISRYGHEFIDDALDHVLKVIDSKDEAAKNRMMDRYGDAIEKALDYIGDAERGGYAIRNPRVKDHLRKPELRRNAGQPDHRTTSFGKWGIPVDPDAVATGTGIKPAEGPEKGAEESNGAHQSQTRKTTGWDDETQTPYSPGTAPNGPGLVQSIELNEPAKTSSENSFGNDDYTQVELNRPIAFVEGREYTLKDLLMEPERAVMTDRKRGARISLKDWIIEEWLRKGNKKEDLGRVIYEDGARKWTQKDLVLNPLEKVFTDPGTGQRYTLGEMAEASQSLSQIKTSRSFTQRLKGFFSGGEKSRDRKQTGNTTVKDDMAEARERMKRRLKEEKKKR